NPPTPCACSPISTASNTAKDHSSEGPILTQNPPMSKQNRAMAGLATSTKLSMKNSPTNTLTKIKFSSRASVTQTALPSTECGWVMSLKSREWPTTSTSCGNTSWAGCTGATLCGI